MTKSADAESGTVDENGCDFDGCSGVVYKRHCKIVCEQHGVLRDCSDPFR